MTTDIMCCVINFHGGGITPWHDDRQARDHCLRWSFTGTLPAVFMSTKLDIFRNELGHSSWVCGDKNRPNYLPRPNWSINSVDMVNNLKCDFIFAT